MNKKLFKRLLIASGLIAPVVMITPMILTSCNDNSNNNQGGDKTPSNENLISLGNFNDLLKSRPIDETNKDKKEFWLDVVGFHGNIFSPNIDMSDFKDTEAATFYKSIVNNKREYVTKTLIEQQGFEVVKSTQTKEGEASPTISDWSEVKLIKTNDKYSQEKYKTDFKKVFSGLYLSNVFDSNVGSNTNGIGLTMKWDNVNFEDFLKKVNTTCEISIIDKAPTQSQTNVLDTSNFTIKYTFKPIDGMKWAGVKDGEESLPLIVTLKDYVDNISIISDLSTHQPIVQNQSNQAERFAYENKNIEVTLSNDDKATMRTQIATLLGIKNDVLKEPISGQEYTKIPIDSNAYEPGKQFQYISYLFSQIKDNSGNNIIQQQNFNDAILNKRISSSIIDFTQAGAPNFESKITIRTSLELETGKGNIPPFSWFLNFVDHSDNRQIVPIDFELTFKKATTSSTF